LRFGADRRNLVEENRALVGDLKRSLLGCDGAGEGSLYVAKELRLEQVHRNGAGIDRDESFVSPRRSCMDAFRDDFLAGTAFARDQHGRTRRRDLSDQVEYRQHFFALTDDVWEVVALLKRALEMNIFLAQTATFNGERHLGDQLVVGPWLGDVILRAIFERCPSHVDGPECRNQDHA